MKLFFPSRRYPVLCFVEANGNGLGGGELQFVQEADFGIRLTESIETETRKRKKKKLLNL